ncbi:MAG: hypothetical protein LDL51_02045 [Chloroflexi bacterium]|nr:hypothetical protein [Chloroflexota bacterium]
MTAQTYRWIFVLTISLLAALAALASLPAQASAQTAGASDNTCLTCHEDLYYLHDTGCWYCMTPVHKDRCVDCHEGNPASTKIEESHLGMLAHPQENGGAKCLECHEQADLQSRLTAFDAKGGFDEVVRAEAYVPSAQAEAGLPAIEEVSPLTANWKWLVGGFIAFGVWLILVFFSPLKP